MSVATAIEALLRGQIIGVPTDTVYGLGVDPNNADAVRRVFDLKGRSESRPLVVLAASLEQATELVEITDAQRETIAPHWPGRLTAILPMKRPYPVGVGDHVRETLAIRVAGEPSTAELVAEFGPIALTSANLSGETPAVSDQDAIGMFGGLIPVYLSGSGSGVASTVADFTVEPPAVLRRGPVIL